MKPQAVNTVLRDFGSTLFGFAILYHQTFITTTPHGELLLTALALLAVPGATGLLSLWLGGRSSAEVTAEPGSSSPAARSPSP